MELTLNTTQELIPYGNKVSYGTLRHRHRHTGTKTYGTVCNRCNNTVPNLMVPTYRYVPQKSYFLKFYCAKTWILTRFKPKKVQIFQKLWDDLAIHMHILIPYNFKLCKISSWTFILNVFLPDRSMASGEGLLVAERPLLSPYRDIFAPDILSASFIQYFFNEITIGKRFTN